MVSPIATSWEDDSWVVDCQQPKCLPGILQLGQMYVMAFHITGKSTVCSIVYWGSALLVISEGNLPVTDRFPSQRASNVETVSHGYSWCTSTETTSPIWWDRNSDFYGRPTKNPHFLPQNCIGWLPAIILIHHSGKCTLGPFNHCRRPGGLDM